MKQKPIRVLQVVGRMDRGGIETMVMNLYRNMDREKVQFDFLAHYGREAVYNDEIRAMGGRIYEMPALKDDTRVYYWRLFSYIRALHRFFKEHPYQIVHGHMTNTASIYMPIAKKYGTTCLIAHSHNTHSKEGLVGHVTNFLQRSVCKKATDLFACSQAAADWLYPAEDVGKVTILANAVDAEAFRFSAETRAHMRAELGVENQIVIGCVARLRPEKNHEFLVDVLQEICRTRDDVVLMLAGDGEMEQILHEKVHSMGLDEKVRFLGMRTDIPDVLQAMDVFTLASLWEGLPVVGIEAQAAGLPCVVSDGVTEEMNAIDLVEYLSLQESKEVWAERLLAAAQKPRMDTYEQICAAGYDIHTTAPWLQNFYLRKSNR